MNIIFNDSLNDIPNSFTVLELDTFNLVNEDRTATAYCIVEKIPLVEFDKIDAYKQVHSDLMSNYRSREWTYCEHAIEGLMGKWDGELDSFYSDLLLRVIVHKQNPPEDDWTAVRIKI